MIRLSLLMVALGVFNAFGEQEKMRVRYALTFCDTAPIAQFVPGDEYAMQYNSSYFYADDLFATVIQNAKPEMLSYVDVYRKMWYGDSDRIFRVELASLQAGTAYTLRIHAVEFYGAWAGNRSFKVFVNETEMPAPYTDGYFDAFRDAPGKHVPCYWDIENCVADSEGKLNIVVQGRKEAGYNTPAVCAVQLFEPTSAPAYTPTPQVKGYQEFACIIPETKYHRSNTVCYDIEYRDGGDGSEIKTMRNIHGGFIYDISSASEGANREYRVRMSQEGNELWSDWVSAGDRSVSAHNDAEGQKLLPSPFTEYESEGVVSVFHKNASDDDAASANEEAVGETVTKTTLSWRQTDVPSACTDDGAPVRILTSGKVFFPYMADGCKIRVKGTGLVNLWLDNGFMAVSLGQEGGTAEKEFKYLELRSNLSQMASNVENVTTNECVGTAGVYDFYVEQLQSHGVDIETDIEFLDQGDHPIPVKLYPAQVTADISPWKHHQIHNQAQAQTFVVPLNEEKTSFRIYGSGDDTWGGTDPGTFLYQKMKGPCELKMRVTSIGGRFSNNTRYGFEMRSSLSQPQPPGDGFVLIPAFVCRGGIAQMGYGDTDASNGFSIGSLATGARERYEFPVWMRIVSRKGFDSVKKKRIFNFEFSYSQDGETWDEPYITTNVARTADFFIGPVVVAHNLAGTSIPWMEIDNLELRDISARSFMLIIR